MLNTPAPRAGSRQTYVEVSTPNVYLDQIEYFCHPLQPPQRRLYQRASAKRSRYRRRQRGAGRGCRHQYCRPGQRSATGHPQAQY